MKKTIICPNPECGGELKNPHIEYCSRCGVISPGSWLAQRLGKNAPRLVCRGCDMVVHPITTGNDNPLFRGGVLNVPDRCIDPDCKTVNPTAKARAWWFHPLASIAFWLTPIVGLVLWFFYGSPPLLIDFLTAHKPPYTEGNPALRAMAFHHLQMWFILHTAYLLLVGSFLFSLSRFTEITRKPGAFALGYILYIIGAMLLPLIWAGAASAGILPFLLLMPNFSEFLGSGMLAIIAGGWVLVMLIVTRYLPFLSWGIMRTFSATHPSVEKCQTWLKSNIENENWGWFYPCIFSLAIGLCCLGLVLPSTEASSRAMIFEWAIYCWLLGIVPLVMQDSYDLLIAVWVAMTEGIKVTITFIKDITAFIKLCVEDYRMMKRL